MTRWWCWAHCRWVRCSGPWLDDGLNRRSSGCGLLPLLSGLGQSPCSFSLLCLVPRLPHVFACSFQRQCRPKPRSHAPLSLALMPRCIANHLRLCRRLPAGLVPALPAQAVRPPGQVGLERVWERVQGRGWTSRRAVCFSCTLPWPPVSGSGARGITAVLPPESM